MSAAQLVALDWGTTALRGYLLGQGGVVLEQRSLPWGILHLPEGGFDAALSGIAGDWLSATPGLPLVACGMVGSAQGWREAPYVPCPASAESLVNRLSVFDVGGGARLHIVPGVRNERPDVMRGEETQVVGALALAPHLSAQATLLMPGTHSKWVELRDGRIDDFRTFMTGELFAVLRDHSILGRPARAASAAPGESSDAFDRGVRAVMQQGSATPLLFSTRTLVLTGQLPAEQSLDYLSGMLIGDELRCALPVEREPLAGPAPIASSLVLIGEDTLCDRYRRALNIWGAVNPQLLSNTAVAGLWHMAQRAGLLPPT
jgi:2-dehydro-3-deoxygalactonokinase